MYMDFPNLLNSFFSPQGDPYKILPHSSLFPIWNIQRWRWKISKTIFIWGLTSRSVDFSIIRVLYIDYIFIPSLQMLLIITPWKSHQILLDYFSFPIYLWMECCRPLQLHVHILPQYSEKFIEEPCVPIWNMLLGIPKCTHTSKNQVFCFFPIDGVFIGHSNTHHVELINY